MSSLNKVQLIGHLGRDPEVRYTPDGNAVTTLQVATSRTWKDKAGERHEETEWTRVVLFGRVAEVAADYLVKGAQAYIEGQLRTRKWTDKDSGERYSTEVAADDLILLGKRDQVKSDGHTPEDQPTTGPTIKKPVDLSRAGFTVRPDTPDI